MRQLNRRCRIFMFALLSLAMPAHALAQAYPSKPVRIVIPTSPGGNVDLIARSTAQKLMESLGRPVVVESRTGASSIIGSEYVAKSASDGYTLLIAPAGTHTINPGLFKKLPYDTVRDFTAISIIARGPLVLVAHPSLNVDSLKALIALAKSKPGQIVAATGGNGTAGHLALEMLMARSGTTFLQVPYKGNAPGLTDTIAGHTHIMIDTPSTSIPQVRAGKLRALAVTSLERSPLMPDVRSVSDSGFPGYEASVHIVLLGPAGLPREIVNKLSGEVAKVARNEETRRYFAEQGVEMVGSTPEESAAFIMKDIAKWEKVIREAGIKAE
ncbi:MAG: Bug family tripartite tricarboxylate transporter substrate binding protein [Burkholderiales bacterium]